jgi:hypothetical protein
MFSITVVREVPEWGNGDRGGLYGSSVPGAVNDRDRGLSPAASMEVGE